MKDYEPEEPTEVFDFSSKKLFKYTIRLSIFFCLLLFILAVIHGYFEFFYQLIIDNLDPDSLNNMVNLSNAINNRLSYYGETEIDSYSICILQGYTTIIALVATITIIAVQLTASSYSPLIIDILAKKKPKIWIMLIVYIILMAIIWLSTVFPPNVIIVFLISILGFISLILIIPYIAYVLEILTPEHITQITADDIIIKDGDYDFDKIEKKFEILVDIILASIKNHNSSSTIFGLSALKYRLREYVNDENKFHPTEPYLLDKFFYIKHIFSIFDACNSSQFFVGSLKTVDLMEDIGVKTIRLNPDATYGILLSMFSLGMNLPSPNSEINFRIIQGITTITLKASKNQIQSEKFNKNLFDHVNRFLDNLIEKLLEKNKKYNSANISYGIVISLVNCYEDLSVDLSDPFELYILEILKRFNPTEEEIKLVLSEIEVLWSNPKNLHNTGDLLIKKLY